MAELTRSCRAGGFLAGGRQAIPELPADFAWPSPGPDIPCNAMRCGHCGGPVSSRVGWRVPEWLNADRLGPWLRGEPGAEPPAEAQPDSTFRLHFCGCGSHYATQGRYVEDPAADDQRGAVPDDWRCGGHPPLDLPAQLDGVQLAAGMDWVTLAQGVLSGTLAASRPAFTQAYPVAWLQRLYNLLEHPPAAAELGGALGAVLASGDLASRVAALDFFWRLPAVSGASAVEETVLRDGRGLEGQARPDRPHETVGKLIHLALASRLEATGDGGDVPEPLREASRLALGWRSPHAALLIRQLAPRDPDWVADHLGPLYAANPETNLIREAVRGLAKRLPREELVRRLDALGLSPADRAALPVPSGPAKDKGDGRP